MKAKRQTKFERACIAASEQTGIEVEFDEDERPGDDAYEDDGTLHIRRRGVSAAFDVSNNQDLSGAQQNANTRKVLEALGMKITERALVEESKEQEDEGCDCWACEYHR